MKSLLFAAAIAIGAIASATTTFTIATVALTAAADQALAQRGGDARGRCPNGGYVNGVYKCRR